MDYDSPQFVAAIKKILRHLAGETDEDKRAVSEQANAQVEKELPPPITELYVSDSTIDRIKTPTAHETSHEWWKDFVEVAGIGVLTLYTIFAYFQWKELDTANLNQSAINIETTAVAADQERRIRENAADTHELAVQAREQAKAAQRSANLAAQSLKALKDQFQLEQRPYVTITSSAFATFRTSPAEPPTKGKPVSVNVYYVNVGKSQALNTVIHRHLLCVCAMRRCR